MFCKKCGKECLDEAVICIHCGCLLDDNMSIVRKNDVESPAIGILSIIFAVLFWFVGLIFSIIGLNIYTLPKNKLLCKIGLIITCVWAGIVIIFLFISFAFL